MPQGTGRIDWSPEGNHTLAVSVLRRDTYPLITGRGSLSRLPDLVQQISECDSLVAITDDNVAPILLSRVTELLTTFNGRVQTIVIPAGERSKSWAVADQLLTGLCTRNVKRRTLLLALGGGVVCDVVGFVASVFMRGIPYINVPTSLMAQLDAAIGGKTGIDYDGAKNLVGAFHHPAGVLVDPELLVTLPNREISSGLAEAVKVGILNPQLFARLENLTLGPKLDLDSMAAVVEEAIVCKLVLLREDPFEQSLRRFLNLGHTFAHAIEAATGFSAYRHGEAVAIGIAIATTISRDRELCSTKTMNRILACLETCGLSVTLPTSLVAETWERVTVIRRVRNGKLNEVLPVSIGECVIVDEMSYEEYAIAVRTLERRAARPLCREVEGVGP
jgi:3-dehydroquinate synthase